MTMMVLKELIFFKKVTEAKKMNQKWKHHKLLSQ